MLALACLIADCRGRQVGVDPILIYSGIEKAFMVYVVLVNLSQPHSQGFLIGGVMDAALVLYTIGYFAVCGFKLPSSTGVLSK